MHVVRNCHPKDGVELIRAVSDERPNTAQSSPIFSPLYSIVWTSIHRFMPWFYRKQRGIWHDFLNCLKISKCTSNNRVFGGDQKCIYRQTILSNEYGKKTHLPTKSCLNLAPLFTGTFQKVNKKANKYDKDFMTVKVYLLLNLYS